MIVRFFYDFASGNSIHEGFDFVKILLAGSSSIPELGRCMEHSFLQQANVSGARPQGGTHPLGVNRWGRRFYVPDLLGPETASTRGGLFEGPGFLTFE